MLSPLSAHLPVTPRRCSRGYWKMGNDHIYMTTVRTISAGQPGRGSNAHHRINGIYRDPTNDYGAKYTQ